MKYRMQIHLYDPQKKGWFFIKGPDGKPYEYEDHNLAYRMLRMCYPNLSIGDQARITDQNGNHQPTPAE